MRPKLMLVKLDSKYCDYLRKYDSKVPYNYDRKKNRPFVGVLFEVNDFKYFAPLSSPKAKYLKMHDNVDFLKLKNGELGAVNFNNMLPVTLNNVIMIDLDSKTSVKKEELYRKMLKEQLYFLNRRRASLYRKASNLYLNYMNKKLPTSIYNRCCNFPLLEEKWREYNVVFQNN